MPEVVVYRSVGGCDLDAHIYVPAGGGQHPGIVFFHGGSFKNGGPGTFRPHCEYFAGRGLVAVDASYRLFAEPLRGSAVLARAITPKHVAREIDDCIDDAAAAVAWVRGRADVDPACVVAAGFSAGGYLAACTGLLEHVAAPSRPDALILQNSPLGLGSGPLSPSAHVRQGLPPTLILSGSRDWFINQSREFARAMQAAGNRCELLEFDGAHTVFRAQQGNQAFADSLAQMDAFLVSLGFVDAIGDAQQRISDLELPPPPKPRGPTRKPESQPL